MSCVNELIDPPNFSILSVFSKQNQHSICPICHQSSIHTPYNIRNHTVGNGSGMRFDSCLAGAFTARTQDLRGHAHTRDFPRYPHTLPLNWPNCDAQPSLPRSFRPVYTVYILRTILLTATVSAFLPCFCSHVRTYGHTSCDVLVHGS